ncbi:MAG: helix-turn-helix transcriptional regulator [Chloroflexi bacterium]|nr:helix-turn-helix transcriptional regulator [Chloroflexota bacterium]
MAGKKKERCPVEEAVKILGGKWVFLIVRDLSDGKQRFSDLQRSLGISPRVLSTRLDELEKAGVLNRQCFAEVPPRVEYTLTAKGRALVPVIEEMRAFGRRLI